MEIFNYPPHFYVLKDFRTLWVTNLNHRNIVLHTGIIDISVGFSTFRYFWNPSIKWPHYPFRIYTSVCSAIRPSSLCSYVGMRNDNIFILTELQHTVTSIGRRGTFVKMYNSVYYTEHDKKKPISRGCLNKQKRLTWRYYGGSYRHYHPPSSGGDHQHSFTKRIVVCPTFQWPDATFSQ